MLDDDLRTALTKLAEAYGSGDMRLWAVGEELRDLLAAHPAEVVSDTRREDMARALSRERLDELGATERTPTTEYVRDFYAKFQANLDLHPGYDDEKYDQAEAEFDRWLAAYEAEVRERIAQDIEATPMRGTGRSADVMAIAADIARGATR